METPVGYEPSFESNEAKVIRHYELHDLIGKTMSLIEMCGIQDKQEKALKISLKREIWNIWNNQEFSPIISSDAVEDLLKKSYELNDKMKNERANRN